MVGAVPIVVGKKQDPRQRMMALGKRVVKAYSLHPLSLGLQEQFAGGNGVRLRQRRVHQGKSGVSKGIMRVRDERQVQILDGMLQVLWRTLAGITLRFDVQTISLLAYWRLPPLAGRQSAMAKYPGTQGHKAGGGQGDFSVSGIPSRPRW